MKVFMDNYFIHFIKHSYRWEIKRELLWELVETYPKHVISDLIISEMQQHLEVIL